MTPREVLPLLTKLEMILKRAAAAREVDIEFAEAYADALSLTNVEPFELDFAGKMILAKEEWFPSPATIIRYVEEFRERRKLESKRHYWSSLVEATNADGVAVLAPPNRVLDGRVLPVGERGNGRPAPPSLPTLNLETMSDGGLLTYYKVTGSPEAAKEIARRNLTEANLKSIAIA